MTNGRFTDVLYMRNNLNVIFRNFMVTSNIIRKITFLALGIETRRPRDTV